MSVMKLPVHAPLFTDRTEGGRTYEEPGARRLRSLVPTDGRGRGSRGISSLLRARAEAGLRRGMRPQRRCAEQGTEAGLAPMRAVAPAARVLPRIRTRRSRACTLGRPPPAPPSFCRLALRASTAL